MHLDQTVNFYFSIFKRKGLFSYFDDLENSLIKQYDELCQNSLNTDINLIEEYFLKINTGVNEESYNISWSIPKAKEIIHEEKVKASEIKIDNLYSDYSNLEKDKLKFYENQNVDSFNPIIASYYLPINKLIVIDGNHRHYLAQLKGRKNIRVHLLSPFANSLTMNEKNFKTYSFHHNLFNLLRLCCDPFTWELQNNKSLKNNTYYGNVKFDNLLFKKMKMLFKKPYLPKAQ